MEWQWDIDVESDYYLWEPFGPPQEDGVEDPPSEDRRNFEEPRPCRGPGVSFYEKPLKRARANNFAWLFKARIPEGFPLQSFIQAIDSESNKAYILINEEGPFVTGYVCFKNITNAQLLRYSFGDFWDLKPAPGGCVQNKDFLKKQLDSNTKLLYSKGYPEHLSSKSLELERKIF